MGAASESLKNAAEGISNGADQMDPTITAAKEIGGIIKPVFGMLKPFGRIFGLGRSADERRQRQNVLWYRRIWSAIRSEGGGGRGGSMMLTALVAAIGMLLAPLKALSRMLGVTRAAGALAGAARAGAGMFRRRTQPRAGGGPAPGGGPRPDAGGDRRRDRRRDRTGPTPPSRGPGPRPGPDTGPNPRRGGALARGAKGILRKLPLIGALFGAGLFANAAMAKEDASATPEQKQADKTDRYRTMGGVAGGMLGGVLGMIGGPAGAIVGGMLGDQLGTAVGEWLSTVDMTGMMAGITSAWETVAGGASKMASDAFGTMKEGWNSLVSVGTGAFTSMTDWAKDTWKSATDKVMALKDTVDDKVQTAKDYVGEKATAVKDAGQNLAHKITGGLVGGGGSEAAKAEMVKAMDAGGITDQKSKAALMANVDHESGGFKAKEENLNYSAKRLQEVFPKYYKTPEDARGDAGNPEAIANKVYGGRMGNTEAGDGYKYRGRGNLQLTGKAQYEEMGKKLGVDLVNNPDLAMDPKYSAQIAVQHWKSSGADKAAQAGDMTRARKLTNGGTNGLADVNSKYDAYLAQAKAGDLTPTRRADQVQVAAPAAATGAIASALATVKGAGPASSVPGATSAPGKSGAPSVPAASVTGIAGIAGVSGGAGISGSAPVAPKGAPLGMLPMASMAPTLPATVSAPAQAAPAAPAMLKMASVEPIALPPVKMPTYAPPAADASLVKLPSTPQVTKPMMGGGNSKPAPPPQAPMMLSQDMEDRRIAHAATGGLGGASLGRM